VTTEIAADIATRDDPVRAITDLVRPGLKRLEHTLVQIADTEDAVLAPMLSTVLPGSGKRIRPALSLLVGRLGDVDDEAMNHMAVGVELLHTASLVHDDVVDDSGTRRGSATLFTRVGNALAVLVGDYLFAQAARACVGTGNLRVVQLFAETLGAMAQGQIDDANIQASGHAWRTLSRDRYYRTIRGKTAALFVLACEGSAILAGLTPRQVAAMHDYGEHVGLAFQVVDDILDFVGTEETLGKPVASDLRQGTITLPVLLLRDRDGANGPFSQVFESTDVEAQVRLVQNSSAIDASYGEAAQLVASARQALRELPDGPERRALDGLAEYIIRRRQ
jgi:heptaprenyl diphosphate synthase/octaprenyl-diphosphate synthase